MYLVVFSPKISLRLGGFTEVSKPLIRLLGPSGSSKVSEEMEKTFPMDCRTNVQALF